ncbi:MULTISPECIES: hypothetical protein [Streptomyces]|nr:hypothetical protein [Streptomyces sp. NEAU-383]
MSKPRKTQPAKSVDIIKRPGGISIVRPGRPMPTQPTRPVRPGRPIGGC